MKRKYPARSPPSTSLSELYRDTEPPRKKPRICETTQYRRSNRRTWMNRGIERRVTRSQASSRSRSPPINASPHVIPEAGETGLNAQEKIQVAWWGARVTESSASSDGKASAKRVTRASRSMRSSPRISTRDTPALGKSRVNRGSLTDEDRVDDHDPRMSEDYLPLSPPSPENETRRKRRKPFDVNESERNVLPIKTIPEQNVSDMMAAGDYIPFSPDSPIATRHQGLPSPGPRRFSAITSRLRTRIGNESPPHVDGVDGLALSAVEAQPAETEEEASATGSGAIHPQIEVDTRIWNTDLLDAKDEQRESDRIWPARKGGVYCESCFRDECIRWIRVRDKVMFASRLLGRDEVLQKMKSAFRHSEEERTSTRGTTTQKSIILPDQMKSRAHRLFHGNPPDTLGLALLRVLAEGRVQTLDKKTQDQVTNVLSSLRQDIGVSVGHLHRLEGKCKTLIETCGFSTGAQQEHKKAIPNDVVWLWEFDGRLQDAYRRFSIETYTGSHFAATLTTRVREAAIAELWARADAARGNGTGMLDQVETSLGLRTKSDEFLRSIGTAVAQAWRELEQEGGDSVGTAFPCQYCAESESANSRATRNLKGRANQENPWIRPLIWAYEMSAETASRTMAEEFFRLVESRGAAVAEVPGIQFLVDSTGGEKRIVLVEMASVFDAMWKERQPGKTTSYDTPVAVWEKWHNGGLQDFSIV
ncbi:hypothetical protein B0T21DRAFT_416094 [Apiosordaria backusii]|uniref:Uncharacterized protein n=1 Tax=Apiosordaria backusii TaxID=314023 RepID=A0AA40A7C2_9PEZI|nr:hypothetical protein B0T21DRAFT_416094 [Apiosordaria backusii]